MNIKKKIIHRLLPHPISVRHAEYSMILSADDEASTPSDYLISRSLEAIQIARGITLTEISKRMKEPPYYPDVWPGEHYKLLAAFVTLLQPKLVIEIGTYTGLSALTLKKFLPVNGKVVTFDIIEWKNIADTCLKTEDFSDGRLVQYIDDLSDPAIMQKHASLLSEADLIFIDAAKDGILEQKLLENFKNISFRKPPLVLFDDIRVWNMLKIWRGITFPKLDLTSFGHWSGTGLVEWKPVSP